MDKREGITFFRLNFFSHSAKNVVWGTLMIQKCSAVEKFYE